MYAAVMIKGYRKGKAGTELLVSVPDKQIGKILEGKHIRKAELRLDDGRNISTEQRKKAYATIRDISDYTGYLPEEQKEWLKYLHICRTGSRYFHLSDCSMDTASEFINTMLDYALENGIPLSDNAVNRTDDINRYLYACLVHKKCAVCGREGEIHHEDAIGMGNDRRRVDDSEYRKICLCRMHHTAAHQMGVPRFRGMYKVYGIVFNDIPDPGETEKIE